MTRRGSLAYYLAAWVCGCFFFALAVWLKNLAKPATGFLSFGNPFGMMLFYFYGMILGVVAVLLFAILLRQVTASAKWRRAWQWILAGALLAPILNFILASFTRGSAISQDAMPLWLKLISLGPSLLMQAGLWLAIPAGAATAWVLYRVDRAFALASRNSEK
jgi:hypothetical protein